MNATDRLPILVAILRKTPFVDVGTEDRLQEAIAIEFSRVGIPFAREVDLGEAGRIDFLVDDIGIEVKIDGGPNEVRRQLARYAFSPRIGTLILLTTCARHARFTFDSINGKPVHAILTRRVCA